MIEEKRRDLQRKTEIIEIHEEINNIQIRGLPEDVEKGDQAEYLKQVFHSFLQPKTKAVFLLAEYKKLLILPPFETKQETQYCICSVLSKSSSFGRRLERLLILLRVDLKHKYFKTLQAPLKGRKGPSKIGLRSNYKIQMGFSF